MAISGIGFSPAIAQTSNASAPGKIAGSRFEAAMKRAKDAVASTSTSSVPKPAVPAPATAVAAPQRTAAQALDQVTQAQKRMDAVLKLAESGKVFSPAELLSLQTHMYRASQELDLAGKVVEKATGGIKQVLQTQV